MTKKSSWSFDIITFAHFLLCVLFRGIASVLGSLGAAVRFHWINFSSCFLRSAEVRGVISLLCFSNECVSGCIHIVEEQLPSGCA